MLASAKIIVSLTALAAALAQGSALAQSVGTAGAANTTTSGTPPGGGLRTIQLGTQIVRNEKIETSASGSVQILFIDRTTLNIGPGSSVTIDKFVFNPASNSGEMSLTMTRGVLRVVGGQVTHTGGATVATPVATVGIRGGVATIKHCLKKTADSDCVGTRAINQFGTLTVSAGGATETISRPGFAVNIGAAAVGGASPISTPARVTPAEIASTNASLTSKGGQSGGTSNRPTDGVAQKAGVGSVNAAATPSNIVSVQGQNAAAPASAAKSAAANDGAAQSVAQQSTVLSQSQPLAITPKIVVAVTPPVVVVPPVVIVPPVVTPSVTKAFALTASNAGTGPVFYLTAAFAGTGAFNVSNALGYRVGGLNAAGTAGRSNSHILQSALKISGVGSGQTSAISVLTASGFNDDVYGPSLSGGFQASTRLSATASAGRASGSVSSNANSVTVDADLLPTGTFGVTQNRLDSSNANNIHTYVPQTAFTNRPVSTDYSYTADVSRTATPSGLGDNHPNVTLNGFVGGLMRTLVNAPTNAASGTFPTPSFVITNENGIASDVTINLVGNSSRVGAVFNVRNASVSNGDTFFKGSFRMGNAPTGDNAIDANYNGARGAYVDYNNFGGRGEQALSFSNGAFVDVNTTTVNGATVSAARNGTTDRDGLLFVTSDTVNAASLFPAVTFCNCDYTKWGFWAADTFRSDPNADQGWSDKSNLATWVAGRPASAVDIPVTGTATYAGHVVASIKSGGAEYVAASNFTNAVNFGTGVGTVSVPSLDGSSYGGVVNLNSGARNTFAGVLNTGPSARNMVVSGAFFNSSVTKYGEMAGSVAITGPSSYLGSGTFAARAPGL